MMQKYVIAALVVVLLGGLSGYLSNAGYKKPSFSQTTYSYKKPSFCQTTYSYKKPSFSQTTYSYKKPSFSQTTYSYKKPSFSPPDYVFGPVWFVLYITIGIAGVNIYENRKRDPVSLFVFAAQLLLNFAWTFLFFGLHRPDLALIDIILLFLTILYLVVSPLFDSKKTSNLILVPYLLWVGFATVLNYSIFMLN